MYLVDLESRLAPSASDSSFTLSAYRPDLKILGLAGLADSATLSPNLHPDELLQYALLEAADVFGMTLETHTSPIPMWEQVATRSFTV